MIILIAALDSNFLIGDGDKLPWYYPQDLLFFKKKSLEQNVLIGFNTYRSLKKYYKNKSFPFQKIYVASYLPINIPDVVWVKDLKLFLEEYKNKKEKIMVIGGSQIYNQSLDYASKMYITHVLRRYKGDSFFPFFNYNHFCIKEKKIINGLIFATYIRK